MEQLLRLVNRVLFAGAGVLAFLAIIEKGANMAGMTLLRGAMVPARLLEHAALALLFVIALQIRELRKAGR